MRVSLKALFGIVAFCAVLAWCVSRVGFDNPMFWIATMGCGVLSAVFVSLAQSEKRRGYVFLLPLPFLLCCGLQIMSLSLIVNSGLLFVAGIFCMRGPPRSIETLRIVAMACAAVALMIGVVPGISEQRQLLELRRQYPGVSLDGWLSYERKQRPTDSKPLPQLAPAVLQRLVESDNFFDAGNLREAQLRRVHNHQHELFVRAIGFGVGRMMSPSHQWIDRPDIQDIPFAARPSLPDSRSNPWFPWRVPQPSAKSDDVTSIHSASEHDFLHPEGFGASVDTPRKVAGFVKHGFHYSPLEGMDDRETWTIVRLELVSLLKFEEPRVYLLDHLPRMDQLSQEKVPTRPLDSFESEALQKLRSAEDIVVSNQGTLYRMLGSLRAANKCLDCHSVRRGELLGAFSYELNRSESDDTK